MLSSFNTGEFIKKLRKKNNLTQKEFADKLGVTYQAISKWENGKNMPDILLLKEISNLFDVDIDELLTGKKKNNKIEKRYKFKIILILIFIILFIIMIVVFKKSDDSFEFKTMSSSCEDFELTGSLAYDKNKTSIYISDVDYCGKENNTIYKNIDCILYEEYNDTKKRIGTCGKSDIEMTLDEFLNTVELNVNNYVASCKMFESSSLYMEIQAIDGTEQKISYQIPISLEENCN